MENPLRRTRNT